MLKQVLEIYELLDSSIVTGFDVEQLLRKRGANDIVVTKVTGKKGTTDFIKIKITGKKNKKTVGVIGRLGGIGARPNLTSYVSDGDGAVAALAVALKLLDMQSKGDYLNGTVIISTHICPNAPTLDHYPVQFMDSPVEMAIMNKMEVDENMQAILSVDTTKGNRLVNHKGFAISHPVKEGYILKSTDEILDIYERVAGDFPVILPLSQQDITPYNNGLGHINSIMQPSTDTTSPVIGVAITTKTVVAGSSTGASNAADIECAARFCLESSRDFLNNKCSFYDDEEFNKLIELYGSMNNMQR